MVPVVDTHTRVRPTGILVVNLGTPDEPTAPALKRYLKQFLWDPRVVNVARPIWWPILNLYILNTRPAVSAALYEKIWTEHGSPLKVASQQVVDGIAKIFAEDGNPVEADYQVVLAMRYGSPSIADGLETLKACGRIVVLPMFPQYCSATTASILDEVADLIRPRRQLPELVTIADYCDHPDYIGALAASVQAHWKQHGRGKRLLMSFHGMPERYRTEGDPYSAQCRHTAACLAEALSLDDDDWKMAFQSRFGASPWLTPYTDEMLVSWGEEGLETADIICPGFSADCLETLEEIAISGAETFQQAGGGTLRYVPALNAHPDHIAMLTTVLREHLPG